MHASSKRIFMASISADGKRAACSMDSGRVTGFTAWAIEIGGEERCLGEGCQGTVSPDGMACTRNHADHTRYSLHDFGTGKQLMEVRYPFEGEFSMQCFTHQYGQWIMLTGDGRQGWLHDILSHTNVYIGEGALWDIYPAKLRVSPNRTGKPIIKPYSTTFSNDTAIAVSMRSMTPGATIRYTLDGSTPGRASDLFEDSLILYVDRFVSIHAQAFSSSARPSLTAVVTYEYNPEVTSTETLDVKLVSPVGGEAYAVSDTISVAWTSRKASTKNVVLSASTDYGKNWTPIADSSIGWDDAAWGLYRWVPTGLVWVSECVFVRVCEYMRPDQCDHSDSCFTITARP